ncbi:MAG: methyltransferase domain-containing protein [Streptococcaceae bacterium]|jgi:ubiquinone/menaquinone biosynthesis C-methylase UbiE|nr:methyltransferase domain-containing protein [Streptococcaceae bacterium]
MNKQKHNHERESQVYYDHIAAHFERSFDGFLSYFFKKFILKTLKIPANSRVIDVGCATGTLLSNLSALTENLDGYGVDISSEMVKIAADRHPRFQFQQGSAEKLPIDTACMDFVICSASFHHFPQPETFLKEAMRVLSADGKLVIAEIHIPLVTRLYNWRLARFSHEGDVKVYTPKELATLFQNAGFQIVKRRIFFQIQYYELTAIVNKHV